MLEVPRAWFGAIAQLGERVLCKHEVVGSIPSGSTNIALRWRLRCAGLAASVAKVISVFEETKVPL